MGTPQHIKSHGTQPHAWSTTITTPHSSHLYLAPFFTIFFHPLPFHDTRIYLSENIKPTGLLKWQNRNFDNLITSRSLTNASQRFLFRPKQTKTNANAVTRLNCRTIVFRCRTILTGRLHPKPKTDRFVEAHKKSSETRITDGFNVDFVCSSKNSQC